MTQRPLASKGERPFFLASQDSEILLNIIVALTGEVSALQDKLDRLAQLAAQGKPFDPAVLAQDREEDETPERAAQREAMLQRVYRIVLAMQERADRDEPAYADIMARISGEGA